MPVIAIEPDKILGKPPSLPGNDTTRNASEILKGATLNKFFESINLQTTETQLVKK